jgi:hypothetical protein
MTWRRTGRRSGWSVSSTRRPAPRRPCGPWSRPGCGRSWPGRSPASTPKPPPLDHLTPYNHTHPESGGATTAANLAAGGHRDHQLKTDRILNVTGNHTLTTTTPSGRSYPSYPSYPHPYADAYTDPNQDTGPDPPPY